METKYITLNAQNLDAEHICCGFSDKKIKEGYEKKKSWLKNEMERGYVFRRLDEKAKVFIEYVPAENAWLPVEAKGYLMINCFWVSGQYKGKGHAKALLKSVVDDACAQGCAGLVTVVGTKKLPFMSDTKWLLKQGFEVVETLPHGFALLVLKLKSEAELPSFKPCVLKGECEETNGLVVYYSNRCPFTEYYINDALSALAQQNNVPLTIIKLETKEQAQQAPTPATIFSVFYKGKFLTTDMSICTASRFAKLAREFY